MAEVFNVKMPDGTVIQNVPAGTTKAQLQSMLDKRVSRETPQPTVQGPSKELMALGNVSTNPLARLTAYGANAVSSIPFLKEFGSATAAGLGYGEGEDFLSRYADLQESQKAMREAGAKIDPYATTTGKVSGLALGLGLGGRALSAATPKNALSVYNELATIAPYRTNALTGGALSALYSAAEGEGALDRLKQAGIGFGLGATLSAPATWLAGKLGSPAMSEFIRSESGLPRKVAEKDLTPASVRIAEKALQTKAAASEAGGMLKPEYIDDVYNKSIENLKPKSFEGQTMEGASLAVKTADDFEMFRNRGMSLQAAEDINSSLNRRIQQAYAQGDDEMASRLLTEKGRIREALLEAKETDVLGGKEGFKLYDQFTKEWTAAKKLEDLENVIVSAKRTKNPSESMRSRLRVMLNSKNAMAGYSPEELKSIEKFVNGGKVSDLLSYLSSRLIPTIAAGTGNVLGATTGYGINVASRKAAETVGERAINKAAKKIAEPFIKQEPISATEQLFKKKSVTAPTIIDELANNGGR